MVQEDWAYTMRRTMQVRSKLIQSMGSLLGWTHEHDFAPRRLCLGCSWVPMPVLGKKWLKV